MLSYGPLQAEVDVLSFSFVEIALFLVGAGVTWWWAVGRLIRQP